MDKPMFGDMRVGDRVWDICDGWGCVDIIRDELLRVKFDTIDTVLWYTTDGKECREDINPRLFWDEVIITPPPRPKRKVTKVLEGWVNVYGTDVDRAVAKPLVHPTMREAMESRCNGCVACVRVTGEYTVEE